MIGYYPVLACVTLRMQEILHVHLISWEFTGIINASTCNTWKYQIWNKVPHNHDQIQNFMILDCVAGRKCFRYCSFFHLLVLSHFLSYYDHFRSGSMQWSISFKLNVHSYFLFIVGPRLLFAYKYCITPNIRVQEIFANFHGFANISCTRIS